MMEQCFKQKVVSNNQNHTILIVDAFLRMPQIAMPEHG